HSEHPNLTHADLARVAFSECMDVADGFASMAKIKHHRRIVHLVASFITRILDHDDMATNTLPELLARAQSAEQQLAGEEQRLRKGLTERAETHTPLQDLDPNESHQRLANALLSNTISSTLDRAN
ncbi:MAG: hypothetical protein QF921_03595, partial [Pseudomonadales bacterium]|nr:hypothetical protein [Pseudomonadales bacterium]